MTNSHVKSAIKDVQILTAMLIFRGLNCAV